MSTSTASSSDELELKERKGEAQKDQHDDDDDEEDDRLSEDSSDDLEVGGYGRKDEDPEDEDLFGEEAGQAGGLDAVPPVCLSFKDLSYSVRLKKGPFSDGLKALPGKLKSCKLWRRETKEILNPMNGHFLPGRLVAIMGPSGAGKTSFLNILSGRTKEGTIGGDILVNGHKMSHKQSKRVSAYVMQEDTLLGNLTPRELLTYSALLRLPRTMSKKEKLQRVEKVLRQLNLVRCADTRVGVPGVKRGISGGERRRVSIGLELIVNPRLLFLDEPTSGLDSTMAEQVVTILKNLARQGRTIICTIHQPSSEIFNLFDDVFFLANGSLVYSGPVPQLTQYFKAQGHPCPKYMNPSDHYMRLFSRSEDVPEEQYVKRIEQMEQYHQQNSVLKPIEGHRMVRTLTLSMKDGSKIEETEEFRNDKLPHIKKVGPRFFMQFLLLLSRCWKTYVRDPGVTFQRLMITINISIVVGLLFLRLNHYQTDIFNRQGVLFLIITQAVFMTGNSVLYLFPTERPTFLREYGNGMYGVTAYYLAKSSADLPFHIIFPFIGTTIMYWMCGLREDAGAFFICQGVILLVANIAQSLGLLVSVATELPVALSIFPVTVIPHMLVGGLFLIVSDIPKYFIWLQYISPFFYAFVTLVINEFEDVAFKCRNSELVEGVCPITNGTQQINRLDFDQYPIWVGPICLAAIYILLRFFTYLALLLLARKKSST